MFGWGAKDNYVPLPYSRVGVRQVGIRLDRKSIGGLAVGQEAHLKTDFLVLRNGEASAVVKIHKEAAGGLFTAIDKIEVLADAGDCVWCSDPMVDTAIPSALARKARDLDLPKTKTLVVEGAFGHVNFIVRPDPAVLTVADHCPPNPSRLYAAVEKVLSYADLPPILLRFHPIDIVKLGETHRRETSLYPCRVSGITGKKAVKFLDQKPPKQDWTLIGCKHSEAICEHLYGEAPPRIETCPLELQRPDGYVITRCCLLETPTKHSERTIAVPWGADYKAIEQALTDMFGRYQDL